LVYVREHFLLPYIDPSKTVLEIGPGGGRWTRYMLRAGTLYAVDYHQELLDELHRNVRGVNLHPILNNGDDFPGIPDASVDFGFSFGTFVHLDVDIIERYLANLRRVLAPDATVVIQYSDKTKPLARENASFSENDPETMRALVVAAGYRIEEEDTGSLWHSAIVRFRLAR
jgi:cyclopropane fatty-acyl-phospholipid synthase-like methyltransferase